VLRCLGARLGIVDVFGDSFRALRTFFLSSSAKVLFFCVFRGSLVVVIILHEQSPCALLRLSLETSRCLKRAFEAIECLEVEEKLAVAEEGMSVFSNKWLQRGGKTHGSSPV